MVLQNWRPLAVCWLFTIGMVSSAPAQDWKSGFAWDKPPVVTPGKTNAEPPSDAIVLFDGTDLSAWAGGDKWIIEDGTAITDKGDIHTKQSFGDIQLHIEWAAPTEIEGKGQGRGNSGVFLMERYEVQVLDSYENETYFEGQAGSIYKQLPPMVNAMRKPGEWNTYDILFTAPRFRIDSKVEKPATITVIHNGVVVVNHHEILGNTNYSAPPSYEAHAEKLPIRLQFHRDKVRFRNIWVREITPIGGKRVRSPYVIRPPKKKKPPQQTPAQTKKPMTVVEKTEQKAKPAEDKKPESAKPSVAESPAVKPTPNKTAPAEQPAKPAEADKPGQAVDAGESTSK